MNDNINNSRFSQNALTVLEHRYLLKDENCQIIETPTQMFQRVAKHVAASEANYDNNNDQLDVEENFFNVMNGLLFLPNSPTLMNAGTPTGQLSACFVLPVDDSLKGIFESLKQMALIHQTGGGTGFDFSRIRSRGSLVNSIKAQASGPVSFISVFDRATAVIIQGGRRRGANMAILRCDHPDIIEFIRAKTQNHDFENFNFSVAATDQFIDAVKKDKYYDLIEPNSNKAVASVKAKFIFDTIAHAAWHCGDPGLIFIDEINRHNPTPLLGTINATNPCGEMPLLPYESCNLGSINLAKMVTNNNLDWKKLADTISTAVRFLDDVIDVNKYPTEEIAQTTKSNRKIGLGVMGFADLLAQLKIPYNSKHAVDFAHHLAKFFHVESVKASAALAYKRGEFLNYPKSVYHGKGRKMRNASVNTIAPTGTISIIANCSSGIEPFFALTYKRHVLNGQKLTETNQYFQNALKNAGLSIPDILNAVNADGTIQNIKQIPENIRNIFVTAHDISPADHLAIQAAFQSHIDNAVSKTVNLPHDATISDIAQTYLLAHHLKCKGITIYRYTSKPAQVLNLPNKNGPDQELPSQNQTQNPCEPCQ